MGVSDFKKRLTDPFSHAGHIEGITKGDKFFLDTKSSGALILDFQLPKLRAIQIWSVFIAQDSGIAPMSGQGISSQGTALCVVEEH